MGWKLFFDLTIRLSRLLPKSGKRLGRLLQAGRGRGLASTVLALLIILILLPGLYPSLPSPFSAMRRALFDTYQTVLPRERHAAPVVVVEIDEATLSALGQWPWPRHYLAVLIDAIAAAKPAAIGLDMIFAEADRASPAVVAEGRPDLPAKVREALVIAPSNDKLLAESISRAPVVLGAAGFSFRSTSTHEGMRIWPAIYKGTDPSRYATVYPYVLASMPEFQQAAHGQALLSSETEQGVVRRMALISSVNEQAVPGLALEMLRVARQASAIVVNSDASGILGARVGEQFIPLQRNGEAWVHFDNPRSVEGKNSPLPRSVSAQAVMKGEVPAERLRDKLVLVGVTGIGLVDSVTTPQGDRRPGVEVHAQLLESFADGRFLQRPADMPYFEAGALLVGGLLLIWLVPRRGPRETLLLTGGMVLLLFIAGFVLFDWSGSLFDAVAPSVSLIIIFAGLIGSTLIESIRQRQLAEQALQAQRETAARAAGELAAARRIQLGSLPVAAKAFPGEQRFEIDAFLEPARGVSGDLYDFFMLDARRLFFVVGDVSGKGLPASLFMAVTKALSKSVALRGDGNAAQIVDTTNVELSRDNPEMLFVTLVAGILDVVSGQLELCNAGHDAPYCVRADGRVERLDGDGGPPLCVLDDFAYPLVSGIQLAVGDTLCLITDGVSEAMDEQKALYGNERLGTCLSKAPKGAGPLLLAVRDDVARFVGAAEASDDLTLLTVRWLGASGQA